MKKFLKHGSDILERLGMDVLPYIVLLMVPVLGRMTDQNQNVRTMATHCFATLIRLLPLEVNLPYSFYSLQLYA